MVAFAGAPSLTDGTDSIPTEDTETTPAKFSVFSVFSVGDNYTRRYLIATPAQIGIRESRQIIGEAMAGARGMGTCMAIGQAAGTAAAQVVSTNKPPRELDVEALRQAIIADGGKV